MASDSNASFSLYMAHGGTSFGFWAGANILEGRFVADVTSYDYSAPISEDGTHQVGADGADGFEAVRKALRRYVGGAAATGLPGVRAVAFEDQADLLAQDALATCSERLADPGRLADPSGAYLGQSPRFHKRVRLADGSLPGPPRLLGEDAARSRAGPRGRRPRRGAPTAATLRT